MYRRQHSGREVTTMGIFHSRASKKNAKQQAKLARQQRRELKRDARAGRRAARPPQLTLGQLLSEAYERHAAKKN
jgi:hypothetical protein